jgi:hypothetical protein
MKYSISIPVLGLIVLSMTACTTTSGTDELFDNDVDKLVGMDKQHIESELGAPSDVYEKVDQKQAQRLIQRHIKHQSVSLAEGTYDVWFYEAEKKTHHYFIFFHYNTYETVYCYLVFDEEAVSVRNYCQAE